MNREFIPLGFGVLTVSDTRSLSSDKSGALLKNNILESGHKVVKRTIVPDDKADIPWPINAGVFGITLTMALGALSSCWRMLPMVIPAAIEMIM